MVLGLLIMWAVGFAYLEGYIRSVCIRDDQMKEGDRV